jgi:hypothetical protein
MSVGKRHGRRDGVNCPVRRGFNLRLSTYTSPVLQNETAVRARAEARAHGKAKSDTKVCLRAENLVSGSAGLLAVARFEFRGPESTTLVCELDGSWPVFSIRGERLNWQVGRSLQVVLAMDLIGVQSFRHQSGKDDAVGGLLSAIGCGTRERSARLVADDAPRRLASSEAHDCACRRRHN